MPIPLIISIRNRLQELYFASFLHHFMVKKDLSYIIVKPFVLILLVLQI